MSPKRTEPRLFWYVVLAAEPETRRAGYGKNFAVVAALTGEDAIKHAWKALRPTDWRNPPLEVMAFKLDEVPPPQLEAVHVLEPFQDWALHRPWPAVAARGVYEVRRFSTTFVGD